MKHERRNKSSIFRIGLTVHDGGRPRTHHGLRAASETTTKSRAIYSWLAFFAVSRLGLLVQALNLQAKERESYCSSRHLLERSSGTERPSSIDNDTSTPREKKNCFTIYHFGCCLPPITTVLRQHVRRGDSRCSQTEPADYLNMGALCGAWDVVFVPHERNVWTPSCCVLVFFCERPKIYHDIELYPTVLEPAGGYEWRVCSVCRPNGANESASCLSPGFTA